MKSGHVLLAILVPVLWGFGFTLAKAGLDQFSPIFLIMLRFAVTALALVWFFPVPLRLLPRIALIAFIGSAIQYALSYKGLQGIDVSTAALVIQLEVPFAAIIAALFLRERLGWRRVGGMALAFLGIGLIVGEPRVQQNLMPVLLLSGGAATWAIGQVMIRALGPVGGFTLIAWIAVFAAPELFVLSLIFEDDQWHSVMNAGWDAWAIILYLGLVMNGIGYAMWYHLLGHYPVNQVMPFILLVPVTSVIGGVVLLGDTLTPLIVAGGIIVLSGIAFITLERRRVAAPRPSEPLR